MPASFLAILIQIPEGAAWFSSSQSSHSRGEANETTGSPSRRRTGGGYRQAFQKPTKSAMRLRV
jgi:hypothetical protein